MARKGVQDDLPGSSRALKAREKRESGNGAGAEGGVVAECRATGREGGMSDDTGVRPKRLGAARARGIGEAACCSGGAGEKKRKVCAAQ